SHGETLDLPALDERVPRPETVLGYPLGSRFTSWDRIVAYLEALDAASAKVKMWEYGHTYEGRPLKLVAISSPENIERLDEIRANLQRLADPGALSGSERERLLRHTPAVAWLAYGVHGGGDGDGLRARRRPGRDGADAGEPGGARRSAAEPRRPGALRQRLPAA